MRASMILAIFLAFISRASASTVEVGSGVQTINGQPTNGAGDVTLDATMIPYAPAVSGNWSPVPTQVAGALDQLVARILSSGASIGGTVTGGTAKSVLFVGTGPVLAQDNANFNYDSSTKHLLVGGLIESTLNGFKFPDGSTQPTAAGSAQAPTVNKMVYVSQYGNDSTGDGTILKPYATTTKAYTTIGADASATNRYGIHIKGTVTEAAIVLKPYCWFFGDTWGSSRLNVTGAGNVITLDPTAYTSGNSRSGMTNIYLTGSTGINLDFVSVSATGSHVVELDNIGVNGAVTKNSNNAQQYYQFRGGLLFSDFVDHGILGLIENVFVSGNMTLDNGTAGVSDPGAQFINGFIGGNLSLTGDGTHSKLMQIANDNIQGTVLVTGSTAVLTSDAVSLPLKATVTVTGGGSIVRGTDVNWLAYAPTTPGNWSVVPANAQDALDYLAARPAAAIGGPLTGVTTGSVLYGNGGNFAQDNANFFWNGTLHRLGIGTTTPSEKLSVAGNIAFGTVSKLYEVNANNLFMGNNAGTPGVTGADNVAVGRDTLDNLTTGGNNVALGGAGALQHVTVGNTNIGIGLDAGKGLNAGSGNVAIGGQALQAVEGDQNIAIGSQPLVNLLSGQDNIAMGYLSLGLMTAGSGNVGVGRETMFHQTTGTNNVGLGYRAGFNTTAGSFNTVLGDTTGGVITTGDHDTLVGAAANVDSAARVHSTCLGAGCVTSAADSTVTLGTNTDTVVAPNKVGVKTITPTTELDVNGSLTLSGTSQFSYTDPAGSPRVTKLYIPAIDNAATEVISFAMPASLNATAAGISVQDARTAAHTPTVAALSPSDFALLGFGFNQGTETDADIDVIGFGTNFGDIVMRPSSGSGASQEALRLKGVGGAVIISDTGGHGGNTPHSYSKVVGTPTPTASTCSANCPVNALAVSGDCASTVIAVALTGSHTSTTTTTDDTFNCDYLSAAGTCTATAKCLLY